MLNSSVFIFLMLRALYRMISKNTKSFFGKNSLNVKFIYSEKAAKFCEISTLLLSTVHTDKSKVEILQNFVAFSEYMNFMRKIWKYILYSIY